MGQFLPGFLEECGWRPAFVSQQAMDGPRGAVARLSLIAKQNLSAASHETHRRSLKFLVFIRKRLFQHYRHLVDMTGCAADVGSSAKADISATTVRSQAISLQRWLRDLQILA